MQKRKGMTLNEIQERQRQSRLAIEADILEATEQALMRADVDDERNAEGERQWAEDIERYGYAASQPADSANAVRYSELDMREVLKLVTMLESSNGYGLAVPSWYDDDAVWLTNVRVIDYAAKLQTKYADLLKAGAE